MMMTQRKSVITALAIMATAAAAVVGVGLYLQANRAPEITMVSDNIGSTVGGRAFVIAGKNFSRVGGTQVMVGNVPAEKVEVQSSTTIIATSPKGADGTVPVTVINPSGKSATVAEGFTYSHLKPVIESVDPMVFGVKGGELVTVKGSGFAAGPVQVHFHTSHLTPKVIDDSTLTFIAPPSPTGAETNVNVEIETLDEKWVSDEVGLNYR